MAIGDNDRDVRFAGIECITSLAQEDDLQDFVKSALSKSLDSAQKEDDWEVHVAWIKLLAILARAPFQDAISRLAKMIAGDKDSDVRLAGIKCLISLAQTDDLRDFVKSALSKVLDSAQKNDDWEVRIAWVKLLSVLAQANFPDAVFKVVEMTAKDDDDDVCEAGLKALTSLAQNGNVQMWFKDIAKSVTQQLLKVAMNDKDGDVRMVGEKVLRHLVKTQAGKLNFFFMCTWGRIKYFTNGIFKLPVGSEYIPFVEYLDLWNILSNIHYPDDVLSAITVTIASGPVSSIGQNVVLPLARTCMLLSMLLNS
ncbi:hypothetical protein VKT23_009656 [Stygiomarasmius scandens]|uniref:Uncharacterized protein n=1 Tax=Marasmiellus scandens TaxID=2682957 RepID=A0ABR1JEB1_9AGAR